MYSEQISSHHSAELQRCFGFGCWETVYRAVLAVLGTVNDYDLLKNAINLYQMKIETTEADIFE